MDRRKFKLALFVFRRDLRLFDNTTLIKATQQSEAIIPCFIFDPRQSKKQNEYFSHNCFQFMIESLLDLNKQIEKKGSKLYIFKGRPDEVIKKLIESVKIDAVFVNRDYTQFSFERDIEMRAAGKQFGVPVISDEDLLLIPQIDLPQGGVGHKKFTPFYNKLKNEPVRVPNEFDRWVFYNKKIEIESEIPKYDHNKHLPLKGGRTEGLQLLKHLPKHYQQNRNNINSHNSNLAAHNKFGTISIREFYYSCKQQQIRRSLFWREFYYHSMMAKKGFNCLLEKYDNIKWVGNKKHLESWKDGVTGVPIVDAAMRELKLTGMMHNRLRMIVASYLVKDLLISWKEGEKHFAHYLVDYDPSQNNGNWQWVASTGYDSQPYFRIFNPKLQSQKFDPQCTYIKKWIPQLNKVDSKSIHNWEQQHKNFKTEYVRPIITHKDQKEKCISMYKDASESVREGNGYGYDQDEDEEEEVQVEEEKVEKSRRKPPRRT